MPGSSPVSTEKYAQKQCKVDAYYGKAFEKIGTEVDVIFYN